MPTRLRLALTGGLTLFVGLVIFFPARIAYQWFAPPAVKLASINGSVWYGSAAEASVSGVYLRDVRWQARPLSILTGKLAYAIEASPVSGFIDGNVAIGFAGAVTASELTASLPLQSLQQAVQVPGLGGSLNVQFESLRLEDGVPVSAEGILEVANLVVPLVHRFSIGNYRAEFQTQESGVIASVEDVEAMFDFAGSLQLSEDRSYRFVGLVAPTAGTPTNIRNGMQLLGSANERGQYELRREGQL